jgi:hypothetical protein
MKSLVTPETMEVKSFYTFKKENVKKIQTTDSLARRQNFYI